MAVLPSEQMTKVKKALRDLQDTRRGKPFRFGGPGSVRAASPSPRTTRRSSTSDIKSLFLGLTGGLLFPGLLLIFKQPERPVNS